MYSKLGSQPDSLTGGYSLNQFLLLSRTMTLRPMLSLNIGRTDISIKKFMKKQGAGVNDFNYFNFITNASHIGILIKLNYNLKGKSI